MIVNVHGKSTEELKPKQDWDKADDEMSEVNVRALFSIFNGVCPNKFHKIAH